jgi:hypothetical protein
MIDRSLIHKPTLWLAILAVLESIQLTALLGAVLNHVPVSSPLASQVVPEWQDLLKPEWEVPLFRFFLLSSIGFMTAFVYVWRKRMGEALFLSRLKNHLIIDGIFVFLLLSSLFKQSVYADRPVLAGAVFHVIMAVSILCKIFWVWVEDALAHARAFLNRKENIALLSDVITWGMPILIFMIIAVPNVPAVIARFFFGEQFHHNDSFIFGPALAYLTGCVPNIEVISQYGAGVGVVLGSLMKLFGGFSYESGFLVMMYGVIVYYILCFIFLKKWLDSAVLAAAGILLMIKLQMFNTGVYPFAFTYGSATVMRFWFDIVCLFCIAAHIKKPRGYLLFLAGSVCGLQLFYLPTEGVYLTGAYEAYLLMQLLHPAWRKEVEFTLKKLPSWLVLMTWPLVSAFLFLLMFVGKDVLTPQFWNNTGEFVQYFLSGFGVTPIYNSLLDKQYLASFMGFAIPLVYLATLLLTGALLSLGKINRRHLLFIFLCIYGLGTYHYYVARSAVTSYYVVAIPYVMVLCLWTKIGLDRLGEKARQRIKMIILAVSVWALVTNHNFISYPNRFNVSHNPVTDPAVAQPLAPGKPYFNHLFREFNDQLKVPLNSLGETNEQFVSEYDFSSDDMLVEFYSKEADFSVDAALIDRLTPEDAAVPLISSFEIKMLMQAKRRPYFYYFPLVISHPMRARNFVNTSIYTTDQLQRVFTDLENKKPPYIFMEKIFFTTDVPRYFYDYYPSFMLLRDYVLRNYSKAEQGQYLVALKRKAN